MYLHRCRWDRARPLHKSVFAPRVGLDGLFSTFDFHSRTQWRGYTGDCVQCPLAREGFPDPGAPNQGRSSLGTVRGVVDRGASSLERANLLSNPTQALRASPRAQSWDRSIRSSENSFKTNRTRRDTEERVSIALGIHSVSLEIGPWIDRTRGHFVAACQALSLVGGLGKTPATSGPQHRAATPALAFRSLLGRRRNSRCSCTTSSRVPRTASD